MRATNVLVVILFTVFGGFDCQIHYVPAQILIPTINGTHLATNYTVNNASHVPLLPQYSYNRPSYNYSQGNNSYNITKDGHLIIGKIQPFDRVLFNQVSTSNGCNNSHVPLLPQYNRLYNYSSESNNSCNITKDGHLIIGNIQLYDRVLFNQEYFKPRRWWTYREKIVEYPKDLPAGYSRHETISALRVYNKFYDGNTASATIESGGIGRQYVKIKLQSRWGNGFRYTVQIFGH